MAVVLDYFDNPFALQDLIDKLPMGNQTKLVDALAAVQADIDAKLPYTCPRCIGDGRQQTDIDRCSICYGKGKTEEQVEVSPQTYSPQPVQPSVTP